MNSETIQGLEIKGEFGDAGVQALASVLPQLPKLTQLHIQGEFQDEGAQALVSVLPRLTQLTQLSVKGSFGYKVELNELGELDQLVLGDAEELALEWGRSLN